MIQPSNTASFYDYSLFISNNPDFPRIGRLRYLAEHKINLKTITHSSKNKLQKDTDIYLVDTYGEASKFYNLTSVAFVGGSIIKHGGQNPLEAARFGCNILHGKNISNFREIYDFLK